MACKLTYKGISFEDIQSLTRFVQLETISADQLLVEDPSTQLVSTYITASDFGVEVMELYDNEEDIMNKFDTCGK